MTVRFQQFAFLILGLISLASGGVNARQARTQFDGVYTAAQATSGQRLYGLQCASCHGTKLTAGEMAPSLTGGDFDSSWNGSTLADLVERIRTTMPQTAPGTLSDRESVEILAFILSVGQAPPGPIDLPLAADALKAITYSSTPKK